MAGWHTYIHSSGLHKGGEASAIFIPSLETKLIFEIRNCRRQHPSPPNTIPVPSSDDDVQPRPSLPAQSPALDRIKSGRYQDKLKKLTLQTWGKMHQAKRIPNIHVI